MFLTLSCRKKKQRYFRPNEETTHVKGVLSYISIISVLSSINFLIQYYFVWVPGTLVI